MEKEKKDDTIAAQLKLSKIWQELLGHCAIEASTQAIPAEAATPAVHADPWYDLLHGKGVEIIDLQRLSLHISDQDVDRLLQVIQEQSSLSSD